LSSTSSPDKQGTGSATEILASRYRHLFVLPSAPQLLIYGGGVCLALSVMSRWTAATIPFLLAFLLFILSAAAISGILKALDKKTIADFRRAMALLLAGGVFWVILVAAGLVFSRAVGSQNPLTNAYLYGAFACAGLEFLIINGAFIRNSGLSVILAAIHPTLTLLTVRYAELAVHLDAVTLVAGAVAFTIIVAFPLLLKRMRTYHGYDALGLFQAFMKTWAAGYPDELERIISDHSEETEATTKVLRFHTKSRDHFLVFPGVHPGPFYPIGSYDLPGVISKALGDLGPAMTLHRPGGHERNLATRADTTKYAEDVVKELAKTAELGAAFMRGPVHGRIGKATASATAFSNDLVLTISFAPLGSDDLDTTVESALTKPASEAGFDVSVVDAHNSIDNELESPEVDDPGWKLLFATARKSGAEPFEVAYSHSSEVGFHGSGDLTENGVGLFMVRSGSTKSVFVLADANNSVPALRAEVSRALGAAGYGLIEFCTSDSHNLAARGMTVDRGYKALGEATPPEAVADLSVRLAKLADSRLAPAEYGSAKRTTKVKVFGSKALSEFAALTQTSSKFSRRYFRLAVVALAALAIASMLF
jgi:putative membrane protein